MLEEYQSIIISTYRIMFMGTAHQGSGSVHMGKLLMKAASVFVAADDRLKDGGLGLKLQVVFSRERCSEVGR